MANDIAAADAAPGPVVETAAGKLRGAVSSGIHAFKGVPYGASTAGHNRFMPPHPPLPWTGVRDALAYGVRARQLPNRPGRRAVLETLLGPPDSDTRRRRLPELSISGRRVSGMAASGRSWSGCMAAPSPTARATVR